MQLLMGISALLVPALISVQAIACSVSTQAVVFGNIDVSENSTANGTIRVECPQAAVFALSIRSGNEGADRVMTGPGGAQLRYQLFADPGFIQPWGDGGVTGPSVAGNLDANQSAEFPVFGRVPRQNPIPGGAYADLPIVTLLF